LTSALAHYGVFAVFVLMALDAVFPAASEAVMVYGGALASGALAHDVHVLGWRTTGLGAYVAIVAAGVLGYQAGSIAGWWIGRRGGRTWLDRHGRWVHLTPERVARADRWFNRFDDRAVFLGRITPVARSFVSIPAGVFGMPFARYNVLTLAGNAAWCFALAGAGWALGANYSRFDHGFRLVEIAVVAAALLAALALVVRRRRSTGRR
jgi:membrane protein DedA with SNARE-associated domain